MYFLLPQFSLGQTHVAFVATDLSLLKEGALPRKATGNQSLALDGLFGEGFCPLIPSQALPT